MIPPAAWLDWQTVEVVPRPVEAAALRNLARRARAQRWRFQPSQLHWRLLVDDLVTRRQHPHWDDAQVWEDIARRRWLLPRQVGALLGDLDAWLRLRAED